jgi:hypothetical protein
LISISRIDRVVNTPEGIVVHFRCWCGYRGLWLTGRRSQGIDATSGGDVATIDSPVAGQSQRDRPGADARSASRSTVMSPDREVHDVTRPTRRVFDSPL